MKAFGMGYQILCRALFGLKYSDFNCGFKAYETPIAREIYGQTRMCDWTFDVEVFCLLKKQGIAFAEVPVRWIHVQKKSETSFLLLSELRSKP